MPNGELIDTPSWLLTLAEKSQNLQRIWPVKAVTKSIAGSSSPAYRQAKWEAVDQIIDTSGKTTELPLAQEDPSAGLESIIIPRLKKQAVVAAVGKLSLYELLNAYDSSIPVAAYSYNKKLHAGFMPEGLDSFGNIGSRYYSVALRVGRSAFGAGIGVFIAPEKTIIIPDLLEIKDQLVPIKDLAELYPDTPLF